MTALRNPKMEKFARALASDLAAGLPRTQAQENAAVTAGYTGRAIADNARKYARRPDVKRRVAELLRPMQEKAEALVEASLEWATHKLVSIAKPDLGEEAIKTTDQIAAIKLLAQLKGWLSREDTPAVHVTLEQLVMQSLRPLDTQSIKTLEEAMIAYRAGKLTKQAADALAIARGWVEP
jgi:hypothetical protein